MSQNRPVTSREYKMILNPDRFGDRKAGTKRFIRLVKGLIKEAGGKVTEDQDGQDKEKRQTWYLDTPQQGLRQQSFILRVRKEGKKHKKHKVTLKYREPDRYLSAAQKMKRKRKGWKKKFEEDVTPAFQSKFSHSVSFSKKKVKLKTLADAEKLFPVLKNLDIPGKTLLMRVSGLKAQELFYPVCQFEFKGTNRTVNVCLNFWYGNKKRKPYPLIAEFCFDYDLPKKKARKARKKGLLESYPLKTVKGSKKLFADLQDQDGWINLSGTTKTAYAYGN